MKVAALVQARMNSTRLPGKILKTIVGKPMIELLLDRLSHADELDEIVVSTTKNPEDDELQLFVESLGYRCTRGSELNVLERYYETAKFIGADAVVRITGDCPLIDSKMVDTCIKDFKSSDVDYFSNTDPRTYPDGLDIAIMKFKSIEKANNETMSKFDKEHVTPYIISSKSFTKSSLKHHEDLSKLRWTVDEFQDLVVIKNIFEHKIKLTSSVFFLFIIKL